MSPVVLGVDASLTGTGLCVIPADWEPGSSTMLPRWSCGYKIVKATPEERVERIDRIVRQVAAFAEAQRVTHAFIEDYAFSQPGSAQRIGEVGGCIRLELFRMGLVAMPVSVTAWRKLLIGVGGTPRGMPRGWIKDETFRIMRAAGFDEGWSGDELDALGVCNLGRSELGLPALTLAQRG